MPLILPRRPQHHRVKADNLKVVPSRFGRSVDTTTPVPPPQEGGWGFYPQWGWGYYPKNPYPPGGGGTPPDGGGGPPDGGGGTPDSPVPGTVLVWEDKFSDLTLDQSKWWTRYIFTGPDGEGSLDYLNDEWQRYRETGNHVLEGSGIGLRSLVHNGWFWPSGMLRSKQIFDIADGNPYYFETRCRVPGGLGVWPAFWLAADARVPADLSTVMWPPEIDIFEIVNNGSDDTTWMMHCGCQVLNWETNPQQYMWTETIEGFNGQWMYWYAPFNFADGFHTFALKYERPNFQILCDGQLILGGVYDWVWDDTSPAPPAQVLLNLAIGGNWAGRYGVDNEAMPQTLEIEYVRVWAKPETELKESVIGVDYEVT